MNAPWDSLPQIKTPIPPSTAQKLRYGTKYYQDWNGYKEPNDRKLCCTHLLSYFKKNHCYYEEKIGVPNIDEVSKGYIFEDEMSLELFKEGISVDFLPIEICGKPLEVESMFNKDINVKIKLDNKHFSLRVKPWMFFKVLTPETDPEMFI